jgi:large subunit ribosomal protein L19
VESVKYNKGAILRAIEQPFLRDNLPEFDTGDTVRVDYRVSEGNRTRIQAFEGVVIARQNGKQGARATFTVRKMSFGTGVERVFPLHSPLISELTIVRRGRTRRAKLYYLRDLRGKAARLKTDVARQEVDRAAFRASRDEKKQAKQVQVVVQSQEAEQE